RFSRDWSSDVCSSDLQARKAMVMNAFAQYRQGNYEEAVTAGKRYVSLYPTTDDAAYAQYIVGLSYFRQIRDVTRDQKESRRALRSEERRVGKGCMSWE